MAKIYYRDFGIRAKRESFTEVQSTRHSLHCTVCYRQPQNTLNTDGVAVLMRAIVKKFSYDGAFLVRIPETNELFILSCWNKGRLLDHFGALCRDGWICVITCHRVISVSPVVRLRNVCPSRASAPFLPRSEKIFGPSDGVSCRYPWGSI